MSVKEIMARGIRRMADLARNGGDVSGAFMLIGLENTTDFWNTPIGWHGYLGPLAINKSLVQRRVRETRRKVVTVSLAMHYWQASTQSIDS